MAIRHERKEVGIVETDKILIAFFSHSGNTRRAAGIIAAQVKGDLFEIKTVDGYPADYPSATKAAKKEQQAGHRPAMAGTVADIAEYETVIIGFPNWWGTMPMAVFSFLEAHDLSGKTLLPFCCHGGGGLGRGVSDMRKLAPRATVRDGLALRDGDERRASAAISEWLARSGIGDQAKEIQ